LTNEVCLHFTPSSDMLPLLVISISILRFVISFYFLIFFMFIFDIFDIFLLFKSVSLFCNKSVSLVSFPSMFSKIKSKYLLLAHSNFCPSIFSKYEYTFYFYLHIFLGNKGLEFHDIHLPHPSPSPLFLLIFHIYLFHLKTFWNLSLPFFPVFQNVQN
jgi:hypothetical protein